MRPSIALAAATLLTVFGATQGLSQATVAGTTTLVCPAAVYIQVRIELMSLHDSSGWAGNIDQVPLHDADIGASPGGQQRLYCNYWVPGNAQEEHVGVVHVRRFLSRDMPPGSCRVADDARSFVCGGAAAGTVPIHRVGDPPPPPIRRYPRPAHP